MLNHYVICVVDVKVRVWDISQLDMTPQVRLDLTETSPPTLVPQLSLSGPEACIPVNCRTVPVECLRHIRPSLGSTDTAIFDITTRKEYGKPVKGPVILRYQVSLWKTPSTHRGKVDLVGAGRLPRQHHVVFSPDHDSLCWNQPARAGDFQAYSYFPAEKHRSADSSPKGIYGFAIKTPLTLVPLDIGSPLTTCPVSGRVLLRRRTSDPNYDSIPLDVLCIDYLS